MSSKPVNEQKADQEIGVGVREVSADNTRTNQRAQRTGEHSQVGPGMTGVMEDFQGEFAKSEHWSSSKTVGLTKLACHANTVQVPNLTPHIGRLTKNYQQLSLHVRTQKELQETHPVLVKLEPSSRPSQASVTEGVQWALNSRVSPNCMVHVGTMNPGISHCSRRAGTMAPLR
jgi:hypothetical protein